MVERYRQDDQNEARRREWERDEQQGYREGGRGGRQYSGAAPYGGRDAPGADFGARLYPSQDRYGMQGEPAGHVSSGQGRYERERSPYQQEQRQGQAGYSHSYGGRYGYGESDYERRQQQQARGYRSQEHEIPVYGSGRGPYAHEAGYGAYVGVGYGNFSEEQLENRRDAPRRDDYGAYGAQGYGGEGGSGAQGYGAQGAYGRYGSQSDYGTPGGYGGDYIGRQGGQRQRTGGGAQYGGSVSYGEGAYGGYGQGDMGTASRESRPWEQSGMGGRAMRRGPKGYQRSDERLREEICERLMNRWDIDSSDVTVNVQEGRVTVEGVVPERRMRHAIEDLVDDCHGVQDIENHIRVQRSYGTTASGSAAENPPQHQQGGQQGSQHGQAGSASSGASGQHAQASLNAAQSGQDSSTGATLGSTTRSSAPARSASTVKDKSSGNT